jgi:hypothetical protein
MRPSYCLRACVPPHNIFIFLEVRVVQNRVSVTSQTSIVISLFFLALPSMLSQTMGYIRVMPLSTLFSFY